MDVAIYIAIFFSTIISLGLLGTQDKAAEDKQRERRLAEHRLNARLLRLNI